MYHVDTAVALYYAAPRAAWSRSPQSWGCRGSQVEPMDDDTFAWCLFQEADTDDSGALDRDEVRALARNLSYPMDEAALDKAMQVMDKDKGGEVEFDEFLTWFQQAQRGPKAGWAQKLVAAAKKYMEDAMMGKADNTFAGGLRGRTSIRICYWWRRSTFWSSVR